MECQWAKTLRAQQRQNKNKAYQQVRPYSEPTKFGGLMTMNHWFALDELSKGLYGETACITLRDRYTGYLAAQGTHDKTADGVVDFLVQLRAPKEEFEYMYSDPASELRKACRVFNVHPTEFEAKKTACDSTQPVNKKQNSVAERANAIVQDGARSLLMKAGLPAPYWVFLQYRTSACATMFKNEARASHRGNDGSMNLSCHRCFPSDQRSDTYRLQIRGSNNPRPDRALASASTWAMSIMRGVA